jgi:hypothetical protein
MTILICSDWTAGPQAPKDPYHGDRERRNFLTLISIRVVRKQRKVDSVVFVCISTCYIVAPPVFVTSPRLPPAMTGASTATAQKTKSVASVAGHEFGYPLGTC